MSFHPKYGYPEDYRKAVLQYAEKTSDSAAAEAFRVCRQSISRWRRHFPVSGAFPRQRSQSE